MRSALARIIKYLIGVILGIDLLIVGRTAWRAFAFTITAPGDCPRNARLRSLGKTAALSAKEAYFQGHSRLARRDGDLELWQTPAGGFWVPKGDKILPFLLAEQAVRLYGDDTRGVHRGDVVLDCGANIGDFTRTALEAGARLVVAIEPAPDNLKCLARNFAAEIREGRVIAYPKGVWDQDAWLSLSMDAENTGKDTVVLGLDRARSVRVPLTTIDKLAAELKLPRVDFIKMDIEGAEKQALAGARATLAAFHPRMAISSEHLPGDARGIPALVHSLAPSYRVECGHCAYLQSDVRPLILYFQ